MLEIKLAAGDYMMPLYKNVLKVTNFVLERIKGIGQFLFEFHAYNIWFIVSTAHFIPMLVPPIATVLGLLKKAIAFIRQFSIIIPLIMSNIPVLLKIIKFELL